MIRLRSAIAMLTVLAATTASFAAMEIWAGVSGTGPMDASLPFKDLIWQSSGWVWAELDDRGSHPGTFGGVDRYPWPIKEVPIEQIRKNVPMDENNYPTEVPFVYGGKKYRPVKLFNWFMPEIVYPFGTYTFIAEGTGVVEFGWDIEKRIELNGGTTVVEFEINSIPEIDRLTSDAFNWGTGVKSSGFVMTILESDPNDHVRNIHVIRPDLNGGTSWVESYQSCPFNPQWLADHRIYKVLRFMDWNQVNENGLVNWKDRITPSRLPANDKLIESAPYMDAGAISANHIPYEYQIQACNILGCDYWLNVPARANEDYVRNLAQLCKNRLKPGITVYLEWANETWNTMFIGLHSTDFVKSNYNSNISSLFDAHAYMASRNTGIFRDVLGADRVVGIVSGQAANSGVGDNIIASLKNPAINPGNVKMDAYAITGYFGSGGADRDWNRAAKSTADANNMRLLMYEGGTDHAKAPALYDLYKEVLPTFEQDGFDCFTAFVAVAGWMEVWGSWGHMQYVNQPLEEAYKYHGLYDWAVEHNQFDPNAPLPICESTSVRRAPRPSRSLSPVTTGARTPGGSRFTLQGKRLPRGAATPITPSAGVQIRVSDDGARRVIVQ